MPKSPESEGSPRLMTVTEIAAKHDVSRQTIHTYRRHGVFPSPVEGEGSTRLRFREAEVAAFFKANPKQPRKKRRYPAQQQGDPMDARKDLYAFAMQGKEHSPDNSEKASEKINAYRAAVIREAADAMAELISDGEHDPDCLVDELRQLASKTPETEG